METKRQFSGEFKLQVVMESYQRDTTIEAVCRKLGSQYTFFLQIYAQKGVRNDEDNMNNSQFWQKQYGDNIVDHYEVLEA
jgi:transposase-like protein